MSPFFLISEPFQYTKGSGKGFSKVVTGQFSARLRRAHVLVRKARLRARPNQWKPCIKGQHKLTTNCNSLILGLDL